MNAQAAAGAAESRIVAVDQSELKQLEVDRRREDCRRKLKSGSYVAVVRTPDYQICIPIVRWDEKRFGRSLPTRLKKLGFKPGPKASLAQVIRETQQLILQAAALTGTDEAFTIVERCELGERRRRVANKLATTRATDSATSPPQFINPKVLMGTNRNWNYPTPPTFLNFIIGITRGELIIYGWMIFRADNNDGVFRRSVWRLALDAGISEQGALKIIGSLENRGLVLKKTDRAGQRKPNEYGFLHHPAMDEGEECRGSEQGVLDYRLAKARPTNQTTQLCSVVLPNSVVRTTQQRSDLKKQELKTDSESGAASRGFARDSACFEDDEKWVLLVRTLGRTEMRERGALWAKRFRLCRDAMSTALSDFLALDAKRRQKWNPAAYITTAFESEKIKMGLR